MDTTESIILLAAVAVAGYLYGKQQAQKTAAATAATATTDPLAWLGGWAV